MTERLTCADCGLEFDEGEFGREDPPIACPHCEGLDVLLGAT
jgi:DNA-directed RNA polymerase subunit RPC12/RpoP